jgi:hypothetical protein
VKHIQYSETSADEHFQSNMLNAGSKIERAITFDTEIKLDESTVTSWFNIHSYSSQWDYS